MKVGLAGGIGSGKSYVAARLAARGITVYDCDSAAKRLMRNSPTLRQQLTDLVGSLDKAAISRFLLESEANQQAINAGHQRHRPPRRLHRFSGERPRLARVSHHVRVGCRPLC